MRLSAREVCFASEVAAEVYDKLNFTMAIS